MSLIGSTGEYAEYGQKPMFIFLFVGLGLKPDPTKVFERGFISTPFYVWGKKKKIVCFLSENPQDVWLNF